MTRSRGREILEAMVAPVLELAERQARARGDETGEVKRFPRAEVRRFGTSESGVLGLEVDGVRLAFYATRSEGDLYSVDPECIHLLVTRHTAVTITEVEPAREWAPDELEEAEAKALVWAFLEQMGAR